MFDGLLSTSDWQNAVVAIIIFLFFLLLRKVITGLVFNLCFKLFASEESGIANNLLHSFQKPLQSFLIVLGIYLALLFLPLTPYQDQQLIIFMRTAVIAHLAWGLYNATGATSLLFAEIEKKMGFDLDRIFIAFLSKLMRILILILTLGMVANEWGFEVGGFVAGLGLGGLAFALAAQDTVSNFLGGLVIILDKPFNIGDWIYTTNVEGTVEDISFRSTKVRTFAQAMVTVPNANLAGQPITNWTRMGRRRVSFHLGVKYDTPVDSLKTCIAEIRQLLEEDPAVHKQTIFVYFDRFSESSLDIFIYYFTYTTTWDGYLQVKEKINFAILEILAKEGVDVAFPSRSLYFEAGAESSNGSKISSFINSDTAKKVESGID